MKPMLFNTDMTRAILDDQKTVTRRVIKPQPKTRLYPVPIGVYWDGYFVEKDSPVMVKPPYFPGDVLYVRETWAPLCEAGKKSWRYLPTHGPYCYKATEYRDCLLSKRQCKWRPSIHMPKEAARLFLRVTDVRVERLHEMSDQDIMKDFGFCLEAIRAVGRDALAKPFWDSTIKPADRSTYGWAANPWVWVIEFEREEGMGKA